MFFLNEVAVVGAVCGSAPGLRAQQRPQAARYCSLGSLALANVAAAGDRLRSASRLPDLSGHFFTARPSKKPVLLSLIIAQKKQHSLENSAAQTSQ
jgi:hypothetical protein